MKKLVFRTESWRMATHWGISAAFFVVAFVVYAYVFWLPYRGVNLEQCPAACTQNSDCWVPGCSPQTECNSGRCRLSTGHKVFFSASAIGFLVIIGGFWFFMAFVKSKIMMQIDENGILYSRWLRDIEMTWDEFIGISYHGVNTRLGKEATVYSITGETGLFSFIVMGLPKNTSTREMELDSFFFLHLTDEEAQQLIDAIEKKTGMKPESEYEW